jgi:hypothetical protein
VPCRLGEQEWLFGSPRPAFWETPMLGLMKAWQGGLERFGFFAGVRLSVLPSTMYLAESAWERLTNGASLCLAHVRLRANR